MLAKERLLGLFVGIDKYKYVTPLGGCEKDIRKVITQFEAETPHGMNFEYKTMFNHEATKENLVEAFEDYLIKEAGPNDQVMFYFSGHGAQEAADEVWAKVESDLGLEGLVCYDTGFKEGTTLLGDKELSFLIHKLARKGCDILVVTDSCHSGDVTRSKLKPRRLTNALPQRKWEDFIFADQISKEEVHSEGWTTLVPEGRHIQFAACEDRELAYENENGGIFTDNLLRVLRETKGEISYFDLQSRIKSAVASGNFGISQTPQIHSAFRFDSDVFKVFLGTKRYETPTYGNVIYNPARKAWIFDRGEIHGVALSTEEEDSLLAVSREGDSTLYGRISKTEGGFSTVEFQNPAAVDTKLTYIGFVKGLLNTTLYVAVSGKTETINAVKDYVEEKSDELKGTDVVLVENENEADYVVRGVDILDVDNKNKGYLIITLPHKNYPLTIQEPGETSDQSIESVFADLKELARWKFVTQLQNKKTSTLPDDFLEFEVSSGGEVLGINSVEVVLEPEFSEENYLFSDKKKVESSIQVKIKNVSSQTLYVACIYMGGGMLSQGGNKIPTVFSIEPGIINPQVVILDKGKELFLNNGEAMPFKMDPHVPAFNYPFQLVGFKLIASLKTFDVNTFREDGILTPQFPWPTRKKQKALVFSAPKGALSGNEWQAWTYWVKLPNPYYKEESVA